MGKIRRAAFPFSMHLSLSGFANAPYLLQWLGKERRFNAWLIALRLKFQFSLLYTASAINNSFAGRWVGGTGALCML
jgi:hypothetical protein